MFVLNKNRNCVLPVPSKKYKHTYDLIASHSIILKKDVLTKIPLNLLLINATKNRLVVCDRYGEFSENYIDHFDYACDNVHDLVLTVRSKYDYCISKGKILAQIIVLKSV